MLSVEKSEMWGEILAEEKSNIFTRYRQRRNERNEFELVLITPAQQLAPSDVRSTTEM